MADAQNLKIQQQINEAIRLRGSLLTQQTRLLREQVDIATELKETLSTTTIGEEQIERFQQVRNALREVGEESKTQQDLVREVSEELAEGASKADEGVTGWITRAKKATKQTSLWAGAIGGFVDGISFSFTTITKGLTSILSLATSVASGILQIGKAIVSIPFKIFNALVEEANKGGGGNELRKAYEEVRKEFGNFKEDVAQNVIKSARSMRGELSKTGLSVYRTAGRMYERLRLVAELAKEMGPDFHIFGREIRDNAEAFIGFQKGLGLTGESMKALSAHTVVTGRTFTETMIDLTKFSTAFGKKFGISSKLISRDIGEMQQDMKVFGNLGIKTMTQLSVYSRRLGISFKELQGIVDKFDNFEDAAENAAKLSQAFGLNVDVMKMMNEQDPGKRIDMMRQSFFASGKQIEKMTRQERSYLAATTGVEESALNQVFALKNQAITYKDLEKTGAATERQQITQAQSMKKLSGAIERLVRSGQRMGGFWDRFLMGVRRGVRWSKDFRGTMRNIRRSLWVAERAGRRVGRVFTKAFPGMKEIIKGFREFFHPSKFRKMARGVIDTFKQFFNDLSDPRKAGKALENMFKNFKDTFGRMINSEKSALGKIVSGFKKAFKAVGQIVLSAGKMIMETLTKAFKAITRAIRDPNVSFVGAFKDAFKKTESFVGPILTSLMDAVVESWGDVAPVLWEATKDMFSAAFDKVGEVIGEWWSNFSIMDFITENPKISMAIAAFMFGPAFVKAGIAMAGQAIAKVLISGKLASKLAGKGGAIARTAGKAGALLGAFMVGWQIGSWLDETFDISSRVANWFGDVTGQTQQIRDHTNKMIAEQQQGFAHLTSAQSKLVENQKLKNILVSEEKNATAQLRQVLEGNVLLSIKDREIALEALRLKEQTRKAEISRQIVERKGYELGRGGHLKNKKDQEELNRLIQNRLKFENINIPRTQAALNKVRASEKSHFSDLAKQKQAAGGPKAAGTVSVGLEDLDDLKQIEKIDPRKLKKLAKTFETKIRPAMLKMKTTMQNVIADFEKVDVGRFEVIADSVRRAAAVPAALVSMVKAGKKLNIDRLFDTTDKVVLATTSIGGMVTSAFAEIGAIGTKTDAVGTLLENAAAFPRSLGEFVKAGKAVRGANIGKTMESIIDATGTIFGALNKAFAAGDVGLSDDAMKSFNQVATQAGDIASGMEEIGAIGPAVRKLGKDLRQFRGKRMPVVGAIAKMVETVKTLDKDLSGIHSVNLKPKLENLGKHLGLGGNDTFTINNKNFKIEVNMQVIMEVDEVAEVLLETGKFSKSPNNTKG